MAEVRARAKGSLKGSHRRDHRNETAQSTIWLPSHSPADQSGVRNDPLFQYHRWKANLRVLDIEEIKSLPHMPMSHPFVERLIGSVRWELLDHTFFWTGADLEHKLRGYQAYYNGHRCHSSRECDTPVECGRNKVVDINKYQWQKHCRGLFQLPVAA